MASTNKILNHSVGASFGAGDELILSANALENAERVALTFQNNSTTTIPKGRVVKDNVDGGTDGLKTEFTNGDVTATGLAILLHDVPRDNAGGEVIATGLVTCDAVNGSLVTDSTGAAATADATVLASLPLVRFV